MRILSLSAPSLLPSQEFQCLELEMKRARAGLFEEKNITARLIVVCKLAQQEIVILEGIMDE